jgi:hypothetical protein
VDTEPTGRTIDGIPWEEPRPPHLPDVVTRVSPWVFPFVLLAGAQVVAAWLDWAGQMDLRVPHAVEFIVGRWPPGVCASLLGAALFYRHRNAHRRLPMLVVGVVLLALAALMRLASDPVGDALMAAMPPDDEGWIFASYGIYSAAITVLSIFGVVYMARGLAGARRSADVVSGRVLGIVAVAVVAVVSLVSLAWVFGQFDRELLTPVNIVSLVLDKIHTFAWAYLFVIAFGGWLAGERPRIGWLLVALASIIDLIFLVVLAANGFVDLSGGGVLLLTLSWLGTARWVFLLAAFVLGLPSMEVARVTDEAEGAPTPDRSAATTPDSGAD